MNNDQTSLRGPRKKIGEASSAGALNALAHDFRYGLRSLRRTPTHTMAVVLILGLGIGMATAMFTVVHAVLVRDLPVLEPDRIVVLWSFRDPTVELAISITEVDELRRSSRTLRDVAGFVHYGVFTVPLTEGDRPLVLSAATVTPNFFGYIRILQQPDGAIRVVTGLRIS